MHVYLWCQFCGCCKTFNRVVSLFVANNRCVFFFKFWQTRTLEGESDHTTHDWFSEHVYLYWAHVIQVSHPDPRICVKAIVTVFERKKKREDSPPLIQGIQATSFCVLWINVGWFKRSVLTKMFHAIHLIDASFEFCNFQILLATGSYWKPCTRLVKKFFPCFFMAMHKS